MSALYVCSTPIGNLKDVSLRLLDTLKNCDVIAAEDTRQTKKLLERYEINTKLISYHEHNIKQKTLQIIKEIQSGKNVALVSDAGTPGISDPGYELIKETIKNNLQVIPIPGPSAIITALIVSGINPNRFIFEGFLPREGKMRRRILRKLSDDNRTVVFFESPHRLKKTLEDIYAIFGDRNICIARELTKIHEEVFRGKVSSAIEHFSKEVLGEITIVIEGKMS